MPDLVFQCRRCKHLFPFSNLPPGLRINMKGNVYGCGNCGLLQPMPDLEISVGPDNVVSMMRTLGNRNKIEALAMVLETVKTQDDLERIREDERFKEIRNWLPDSPERVKLYLEIIYVIFKIGIAISALKTLSTSEVLEIVNSNNAQEIHMVDDGADDSEDVNVDIDLSIETGS